MGPRVRGGVGASVGRCIRPQPDHLDPFVWPLIGPAPHLILHALLDHLGTATDSVCLGASGGHCRCRVAAESLCLAEATDTWSRDDLQKGSSKLRQFELESTFWRVTPRQFPLGRFHFTTDLTMRKPTCSVFLQSEMRTPAEARGDSDSASEPKTQPSFSFPSLHDEMILLHL